ncbi:MAG: peptidoglycan-binding protein, partial [Pseudomonadota bacterium]
HQIGLRGVLVAELEARLLAQQDALAEVAAAREALEAELTVANAGKTAAELEAQSAIAEREAALARLTENAEALTAAEEARALELAAAEALRRRLAEADTEMTAMTLALEEARRQAEETLTLLAAAEAARDRLQVEAGEALSEAERREALRTAAEAELSDVREEAAEEARRAELLNRQVAELRSQLGSLQALLDDAAERDEAQQVQIQELGSRLNAALAQRVSELARFRSEFFGRMREVLGGRDDIRIVGDRFVFQSEVLFAPGSANLDPRGLEELSELAAVLRELQDSAPQGLNWILRVDGHTDQVPLRGTGRFRNNWELSQGRALSVVQYLIAQEGVPPTRLAAAGFGEYQPLVVSEDPAVFAANRRIEFKFTER